jgi:serine/threonine protein kinase
MASFYTEGIFASELFSTEIKKSQVADDLIHRQSNIMLHRNESPWLRIDGNFGGMQLDDFKYVGLLGRGGYGSVHLVKEHFSDLFYAIKVIVLKQGSIISKMIKRECIILQMMQHPNVVNLKFSVLIKSRLYLVMTYIRGGNLKQVVERDKLGITHLILWFAELVLALEYVHSTGIIHRDVKPANCMIGNFKLVLNFSLK